MRSEDLIIVSRGLFPTGDCYSTGLFITAFIKKTLDRVGYFKRTLAQCVAMSREGCQETSA